MKKFLFVFLVASLIMTSFTNVIHVEASHNTDDVTIEYLDNGCYFETYIEDVEDPGNISPLSTNQYVTKTKTVNYKNSSGTILWSVSITAKFSYNGTTSRCMERTPNASVYNSAWKLRSITSSMQDNTAKATAIVTYTDPDGISTNFTKSVTITCSPTGVVS